MDCQKRFRLFRKLFYVAGNPLLEEKRSVFTWIYVVFSVIILYGCWFTEALDMLIYKDDLQHMLEDARIVIPVLINMCIDLFLRIRKRSVDDLVRQSDQFVWEDCPIRQYDSRLPTMAGIIIRTQKVMAYFTVGTTISHAMYMVSRVLGSEQALGVNAWFPFDARPIHIRATILIFQIWQDIFNIFKFYSFIGLYATLVAIACTQLEKVHSGLLEFRQDQLVKQKKIPIQEEDVEEPEEKPDRISECIDLHVKVLKFMHDLENTFNPVLLGNFIIMIGATCFAVYSAVTGKDIGQMFEAMVVFLTTMLQLGVYCWFGTQLTDKAESIKEAAFAADWIGAPIPQQRALIFMMLIGNKEFCLSAGGFISVSLHTMVQVLNQALSYTMFLLNFREDT